MKKLALISLALITAAAGAAVYIKHRPPKPAPQQAGPVTGPTEVMPAKVFIAPDPFAHRDEPEVVTPATMRPAPQVASVKPPAAPGIQTPTRVQAPIAKKPPKPGQAAVPVALKDPPYARVALSFVGMDPTAEAVWSATINDPTIPADARKNLIEDLNEDGFPDPKHVTPEDLPLILSRLDLIEQMAPEAMDEANADAFAEAYKDLTNMVIKLGAGG